MSARRVTGRLTRRLARPEPKGRGVTSSRVRFERRAAHVRRRPRLLLVVLAASLAAAVALGWLVGLSPLLAARTVTITGLDDPGERQAVFAAAAIPLGTPLARVDTASAAARVEAIPTVQSATVARSWPSTVIIAVQRKVPVLAVKNPQGVLQVAGADGVPYQTVKELPPGVAVVNATSAAPDPQGVRAAIGVLELLPPAQRAAVTGVTVSSADLVSFTMGSVEVVWGGPADGPKKLAVLNALLPTKPRVIDVSAPDTPVAR